MFVNSWLLLRNTSPLVVLWLVVFVLVLVLVIVLVLVSVLVSLLVLLLSLLLFCASWPSAFLEGSYGAACDDTLWVDAFAAVDRGPGALGPCRPCRESEKGRRVRGKHNRQNQHLGRCLRRRRLCAAASQRYRQCGHLRGEEVTTKHVMFTPSCLRYVINYVDYATCYRTVQLNASHCNGTWQCDTIWHDAMMIVLSVRFVWEAMRNRIAMK